MIRQIAVIGMMFGLAHGAQAEISNEVIAAYNSAVSTGDTEVRLAAAGTLISEAMANPDDRRAASLAYEGAWTLCSLSNCAGAADVGTFLLTLPNDGTVAWETRQILEAYAAWKVMPDEATRAKLDSVLSANVDSAPTALSVKAFQDRYTADFKQEKRRDRERVIETAAEAARHFEPVIDVVPEVWAVAAMTASTQAFNRNPKGDNRLEMAHIEGKLAAARSRAKADGARAESVAKLNRHYYRAQAWGLTMEAYLNTKYRQNSMWGMQLPRDEVTQRRVSGADRVDEILAEYKADIDVIVADAAAFEGDQDRPFCAGALNQKPALPYPRASSDSGEYGSVIVRLSVRDGRVVAPEVLASVPFDAFETTVLETVSQWTWKVDRRADTSACGLNRDNIVLPIIFELQ